jgi:hypothetical protein
VGRTVPLGCQRSRGFNSALFMGVGGMGNMLGLPAKIDARRAEKTGSLPLAGWIVGMAPGPASASSLRHVPTLSALETAAESIKSVVY